MERKILVETSARHVHVTEEALEILFGKGAELTFRKALTQPGQFASNERVTVVGPKRSIENMSILGPCRSACQVELSLSDARTLGITAPVRESGDLDGSAGCKIIGPKGEIELKEGVIIAKRHAHLPTPIAKEWGLKSGQIVDRVRQGVKDLIKLALGTDDRKLIFDDVVVRVGDNMGLAVHIDTDEANAAGGDVHEGVIIAD